MGAECGVRSAECLRDRDASAPRTPHSALRTHPVEIQARKMANIAGYNRKLTALMRKHGLVEEAALVAMGDKAAKEGLLLASLLITEEKIVSVLVGQFGIPYIRPTQYTIAKDLLEIFDPAMMRRFQFVPMDSIGSVLVIAIAGSLTEDVLHEIESQTGCSLQLFLTRMSEINLVLTNNGL